MAIENVAIGSPQDAHCGAMRVVYGYNQRNWPRGLKAYESPRGRRRITENALEEDARMAGSGFRELFCGCLLACLAVAGCNRPATEGPKTSSSDGGMRAAVQPKTAVTKPDSPSVATPREAAPSPAVSQKMPLEAANPASLPEVVMAASDRNACKVFVGDPFPDFELHDIGGQAHSGADARGGKGTVIVFFQLGDNPFSRLRAENLLLDIQSDIASKYAANEITAVAIHAGEAPPQLSEVLTNAEATFPVLVDADGSLLTQLTTKKPPCVFVLDGDGKVAWMDIEYGPAVRKQLLQAVQALAAR